MASESRGAIHSSTTMSSPSMSGKQAQMNEATFFFGHTPGATGSAEKDDLEGAPLPQQSTRDAQIGATPAVGQATFHFSPSFAFSSGVPAASEKGEVTTSAAAVFSTPRHPPAKPDRVVFGRKPPPFSLSPDDGSATGFETVDFDILPLEALYSSVNSGALRERVLASLEERGVLLVSLGHEERSFFDEFESESAEILALDGTELTMLEWCGDLAAGWPLRRDGVSVRRPSEARSLLDFDCRILAERSAVPPSPPLLEAAAAATKPLRRIAVAVLAALEGALELEEGELIALLGDGYRGRDAVLCCENDASVLSSIRYGTPSGSSGIDTGCPSHVDRGLLAVITSDGAGLEVLPPSATPIHGIPIFGTERWIAIPPSTSSGERIAAIVLGHTLEAMTRGRLRAAKHRVRGLGSGRQSTVLQVNGWRDAVRDGVCVRDVLSEFERTHISVNGYEYGKNDESGTRSVEVARPRLKLHDVRDRIEKMVGLELLRLYSANQSILDGFSAELREHVERVTRSCKESQQVEIDGSLFCPRGFAWILSELEQTLLPAYDPGLSAPVVLLYVVHTAQRSLVDDLASWPPAKESHSKFLTEHPSFRDPFKIVLRFLAERSYSHNTLPGLDKNTVGLNASAAHLARFVSGFVLSGCAGDDFDVAVKGVLSFHDVLSTKLALDMRSHLPAPTLLQSNLPSHLSELLPHEGFVVAIVRTVHIMTFLRKDGNVRERAATLIYRALECAPTISPQAFAKCERIIIDFVSELRRKGSAGLELARIVDGGSSSIYGLIRDKQIATNQESAPFGAGGAQAAAFKEILYGGRETAEPPSLFELCSRRVAAEVCSLPDDDFRILQSATEGELPSKCGWLMLQAANRARLLNMKVLKRVHAVSSQIALCMPTELNFSSLQERGQEALDTPTNDESASTSCWTDDIVRHLISIAEKSALSTVETLVLEYRGLEDNPEGVPNIAILSKSLTGVQTLTIRQRPHCIDPDSFRAIALFKSLLSLDLSIDDKYIHTRAHHHRFRHIPVPTFDGLLGELNGKYDTWQNSPSYCYGHSFEGFWRILQPLRALRELNLSNHTVSLWALDRLGDSVGHSSTRLNDTSVLANIEILRLHHAFIGRSYQTKASHHPVDTLERPLESMVRLKLLDLTYCVKPMSLIKLLVESEAALPLLQRLSLQYANCMESRPFVSYVNRLGTTRRVKSCCFKTLDLSNMYGYVRRRDGRTTGDDSFSNVIPWCDELVVDDQAFTLRIRDQCGESMLFKVKYDTRMEKLFRAYASRKGVNLSALRFLLDGERIGGHATPELLSLVDGELIDCLLEQTGN